MLRYPSVNAAEILLGFSFVIVLMGIVTMCKVYSMLVTHVSMHNCIVMKFDDIGVCVYL